MLNYPDFRAFERSYQLMAQVSGRAGRRYKRGKVIIQSSRVNHPVIKDVITGNYKHLLETQLAERKKFRYPPYFRIIEITLKHKKEHRVEHAANYMAKELRNIFGSRVLGPETPMINRVQTWYLKGIMLKFERGKSFAKAKKLINGVIGQMQTMDKFKSLVVVPDVDPM
jgi:primosomal protein N' (replication factor Y)